ncbi:cytidylyltransferase domain-containing protein [Roseovarius nanhaiticus]|uniref:acylneuraminate cytidylyltransferase family protein n=1 Tax=Roseovarius nanhaiticus TaxID=573024 RepID=UPI0024938444|nr:acylneuraminate cytidylyltransferase family protein [Roseovarius nanhaiticus]
MLTIATICARGGSVGVPGKNIRPLMGKPLIAHTIEQALAIPGIDRVFVSTDAQSIADVAVAAGAEVPFLRPDHLATSDAPKLAALEHLVAWIEEEHGPVGTIVDLDPTSPLRLPEDIKDCIALLDADTDVVITGYEADKNPYFNMVEQKENGRIGLVKPPSSSVVARQQAPAVYSMNASIYVWNRDSLTKGLWSGNAKLHVMPRERSVDIDEPLDFDIVELLMHRRSDEQAT